MVEKTMPNYTPRKLPGMEDTALKNLAEEAKNSFADAKLPEEPEESISNKLLQGTAEEHPMDKCIKKSEEKGSIHFGIKFMKEEKRLLLPIVGGKVPIAKFYLEIDNTNNTEKILNSYKSHNIFRGTEESIFRNIVKKIKKALDRDEKIIEEVKGFLKDLSRQEDENKVFKDLREGSGKSQERDKKFEKSAESQNEIKRILKKEIQKSMRANASFLDELKENHRNAIDIFVRNIIKNMIRGGKIKEIERQQTFMATKDLVWAVIADIEKG
jgi:hypothetical protein